MLILTIFLGIVMVSGIRFLNNDREWLNKEQTSCINGLFVIIVFLSHYSDYGTSNNRISLILQNIVTNGVGQLMVVSFLFFSGYGLMSGMLKNKLEIRSKMKFRLKSLFLKVFLSVLIYNIFNFLLGNAYPLQTILLSFIGWISVGNSNWYLFMIMSMYLLTYIIFYDQRVSSKKIIYFFITTTIFVICLSGLKDQYWYNTIFSFWFGLLFCYLKPKFEDLVSSRLTNSILALLFVLLTIVLKLLVYKFRAHQLNWILYNIMSISFILSIITTIRFMSVKSAILLYLSKYTFEIYMFQRLFFTIFIGNIPSIPIIEITVVFSATLAFSIVFRSIVNRMITYLT